MFEYKYKQVIVVRNDLHMSKGKLASQVAHASVSSFYRTLQENPIYAKAWLDSKQPKIILKVDTLDTLLEIKKNAEDKGLITELISDAGLTELPSGTITCLGIGPAPNEIIDEVTGELKLL